MYIYSGQHSTGNLGWHRYTTATVILSQIFSGTRRYPVHQHCNAGQQFYFMLFLISPPWEEQPLGVQLSIWARPDFPFGRSFYCEFSGLFCWQMTDHTGDNLNLQQCEAAGDAVAICRGRAFSPHRLGRLLPSSRESSRVSFFSFSGKIFSGKYHNYISFRLRGNSGCVFWDHSQWERIACILEFLCKKMVQVFPRVKFRLAFLN